MQTKTFKWNIMDQHNHKFLKVNGGFRGFLQIFFFIIFTNTYWLIDIHASTHYVYTFLPHKSKNRRCELTILHNKWNVGYPSVLKNKYSLTHCQKWINKLVLITHPNTQTGLGLLNFFETLSGVLSNLRYSNFISGRQEISGCPSARHFLLRGSMSQISEFMATIPQTLLQEWPAPKFLAFRLRLPPARRVISLKHDHEPSRAERSIK